MGPKYRWEKEELAAAQQRGRTRLARLGLPEHRAQEVQQAGERHGLTPMQQCRVEHRWPVTQAVAALATARDA